MMNVFNTFSLMGQSNKFLKAFFAVSTSTLSSRILGLGRDILLFASLGANDWTSAFIFAFTLPNLFRRLFGEGALNSTLIPTIATKLEKEGKAAAFDFLSQLLTWAVLILSSIAAIVIIMALNAQKIPHLPHRWHLGLELLGILFPYMVFICLSACFTGPLNVLGYFTGSALSQIWLNLTMIAALGVGCFLPEITPLTKIYLLCAGVWAGGVLQLAIPWYLLNRQGFHWRWSLIKSPELKTFWLLFVPGLSSAAVFQCNTVIARFLAFWSDSKGVSLLYLGNRILELPLGIFTIAIITVLFPNISRLAAKEDWHNMAAAFRKTHKALVLITIPAACGLIVLSGPTLKLFFLWGKFTESDVVAAQSILCILSCALPIYSLSTLLTRCFQALKDMYTPFKLACLTIVSNTLLSFMLIPLCGIQGLAGANALSAILQNILLHRAFKEKHTQVPLRKAGGFLYLKCFSAAALMGAVIIALQTYMPFSNWIANEKLAMGLDLAICIPCGMGIYFVSLWVMGLRPKDLLQTQKNPLLD